MSIAVYALRRMLSIIPLIVGISILQFIIFALSPINPVSSFVNNNPNVLENRSILEAKWGLHEPLYRRYLDWAIPAFTRLDFGTSWLTNKPVMQEIIPYVEKTVLLFGVSFILTIIVSTVTGVISAMHHNSIFDHSARVGTLIGYSMPSFVVGLLLITSIMSLTNGHAIPIFTGTGSANLDDYLDVFLAAAITMLIGSTAFLTRLVRSQMLEILNKPYIRTARAKGLSERMVILKHALRNAMLPFVTVIALAIPGVLSGSPIIEQVFNYPGIGRQIVRAALYYDVPVILAINLFFGTLTVVMMFFAEILYAIIDPRIRL